MKMVGGSDKVIIEFRNVDFLQTHNFVMLACLIEQFHLNNCKISFQGGSDSLNKHLDKIKFKLYWENGFNREEFTNSLNSTTLCLWKICENMIYNYSVYAKRYFSETFFNDRDLLPLSMNLEEVFNNIFDHSNSAVSGYVVTQYFPRKKKLSFSVCDFGIGILNSINNYLRRIGVPMLDDQEALRKSLEKGFTVQSTKRNRGFGLDNFGLDSFRQRIKFKGSASQFRRIVDYIENYKEVYLVN